ncbi:MAG: chromosomal replication initiator protein DnaA [candidate division FCPU426 bacterium]
MTLVKEPLWRQTLDLLSSKLDASSYDTWFSSTSATWTENTLVIHVPSQFILEWISMHYLPALRESIEKAAGKPVEFSFKVDESSRKRWEDQIKKGHDAALETGTKAVPKAIAYQPSAEILKGIPLNQRYNFDNFIIGNSNRFACAASMAVGESPSMSYNPLFIYGKVGLGKTHLLHAIANHIRRTQPEKRVLYVSSEIFLNEMVRCLRSNRMDEFRTGFRDIDVLLVDDIQFMEKKDSMQQEFYQTFNALFEHSKQIVASSDSHPRDIQVFDKLRSRFEWGLTVDIQSPDLETRIAILKKKCELEGLMVPNDVILLIAESMRNNIRDMEGSLTRVAAYASLTKQELTLDQARQVLRDVLNIETRVVGIDRIQNETAANYNIKVSELRGRTRTANVVMARQVAMYIARELTQASLTEIGESFGGKNHSTVIYAIERVREEMEKNGVFVSQVDNLVRRIKA